MSNATNTPASTNTAEGEKAVQAFYTQKDSTGTPVSIWVTKKTKDGSPDFDGSIGEQRVAGYVHKGANGGFVSFIDSKAGKDEQGHYTQVGTGNIVVNAAGIPKLAIKLAGKEESVWAECSLKLSQDQLVSMGLNLEIQAAKKAEHAAKKAAATA